MRKARPHGFSGYIAGQGFHALYLVRTLAKKGPLKVGIARDPLHRLRSLQSGHFDELVFHRFWWLPGRAIAARIEQTFKEHFASVGIRGEWFKVDPSEAEAFVVAAIRFNGTWGIDQAEMAKLMEQWKLRQIERSLARISAGSLLARAQQVRLPATRLAR